MFNPNSLQVSDTINHKMSQRLHEIPALLAEQHTNPLRVSAYRHATNTVDNLKGSVKNLIDRKEFDGLTAL